MNLTDRPSLSLFLTITLTLTLTLDRDDHLSLLELISGSDDGTIRVWGFNQDDGLKVRTRYKTLYELGLGLESGLGLVDEI